MSSQASIWDSVSHLPGCMIVWTVVLHVVWMINWSQSFACTSVSRTGRVRQMSIAVIWYQSSETEARQGMVRKMDAREERLTGCGNGREGILAWSWAEREREKERILVCRLKRMSGKGEKREERRRGERWKGMGMSLSDVHAGWNEEAAASCRRWVRRFWRRMYTNDGTRDEKRESGIRMRMNSADIHIHTHAKRNQAREGKNVRMDGHEDESLSFLLERRNPVLSLLPISCC